MPPQHLSVFIFGIFLLNVRNTDSQGTLITTSAQDRIDLITQFNGLRSTRGSSNIQCLTYNTDLETIAQTQVTQCDRNVAAPTSTASCYGTLTQSVMAATTDAFPTGPTLGDIVFQWNLDGDLYYTYATDVCQTNYDLECSNFRAYSGYSQAEVGCARATCTTIANPPAASTSTAGVLAVCVYGGLPTTNTASGQPYATGTCSPSACTSYRNTCTSITFGTATTTQCCGSETPCTSTSNIPLTINDPTAWAEWIARHNDLRALQGSSNMECVVGWDSSLASVAQSLSDTCQSVYGALTGSATSCYPNTGITYNVDTTSSSAPSAADVTFNWLVEGSTYYTLSTNGCTATGTNTCDNFKQSMFYAVSEIGCGQTYCSSINGATGSGYVTVCAYGQSQTGQSPYNTGTACSSCQTYKNTCTNSLCCGNDTQCETGNTLYQRFSSTVGDHFYTASSYEAQVVTSLGYGDEGTLGTVWGTNNITGCSQLVPMYRLYNGAVRNHFYTTSEQERSSAQGLGYELEEIAWYCVPNSGDCSATVPFYRYYHNAGDHYYSTTQGSYNGYNYEKVECYIRP